jgi:23S rRNA pseudouridine1911/1915/1917 synthase
MQEYTLTVLAQDSGKRLDLFLIDFAKNKNLGFSRTFIQAGIIAGNVSINGVSALKPHSKVKAGDEIKFSIAEKPADKVEAEDIKLDVVYEDDDLAVINKPIGMVVHPAPGNFRHTLVNALLYRFKNLSDVNPQRPGIVHRLDKDTSGLLVIAKNNPAHHFLTAQFAKHTIKRKYIALVKGRMEFDENVIEMPIGRHPKKRESMSVGFGEGVKYARTRYRTLKRAQNFSYLELEPFTGRTHQLRVHLAYLGHPILGDAKYGKNNEFGRLALHARLIGFTHPVSGEFMEFSCKVPREFTEFLNKS